MLYIQMSNHVFSQIKQTIGSVPCEAGGVLGLNRDGVISAFYYDEGAGNGTRAYRPSSHRITAVVNQWSSEGIRFAGFIHSHPSEPIPLTQLSPMDKVAAEMTMGVNGLPWIYMALLVGEELFFYKLVRREGEGHSEIQNYHVEII